MSTHNKKYYLPIVASAAVWEGLNITGTYVPNLDKVLHGVMGYSLNGVFSNKYSPKASLLLVSSIAVGWEVLEKILAHYGIPLTINTSITESLRDTLYTIGGAISNYIIYRLRSK